MPLMGDFEEGTRKQGFSWGRYYQGTDGILSLFLLSILYEKIRGKYKAIFKAPVIYISHRRNMFGHFLCLNYVVFVWIEFWSWQSGLTFVLIYHNHRLYETGGSLWAEYWCLTEGKQVLFVPGGLVITSRPNRPRLAPQMLRLLFFIQYKQ